MVNASQSSQGLAFPDSAATCKVTPTTPMRRFLCKADLMRPFLALGKRHREEHLSVVIQPTVSASILTPGIEETVSTTGAVLGPASESPSQRIVASGRTPEANQHDEVINNFTANDHLDLRTFLVHDQGLSSVPSLAILPPDQVQPDPPPSRARLAIQQHDHPLDAIVITTLPSYPFCCHEDLLTMSREQLVAVASLFNAHLPSGSASTAARMIDTSEERSDGYIRHCIEVLCGIVPEEVPGAPKAVRSRTLFGAGVIAGANDYRPSNDDWLKGQDAFREDLAVFGRLSPPTSPSAMRLPARRSGGIGPSLLSSPSGLERLEEESDDFDFGEDSDDVFDNHRAVKRRRLSDAVDAAFHSLYTGLGTMQTLELNTPTRQPRPHPLFVPHRRPADLLLPPSDGASSDVDIDMTMQSSSPLQDRSRHFRVHIPPLAPKPKLYRSKQKSLRRSASKRAQQICRPMGKLHMNSDPPFAVGF